MGGYGKRKKGLTGLPKKSELKVRKKV